MTLKSMLYIVCFGLGTGLLFLSIFKDSGIKRFKPNFKIKRRSDALEILKTLQYFKPLQYAKRGKLLLEGKQTKSYLENIDIHKIIQVEQFIVIKFLLFMLPVPIYMIYQLFVYALRGSPFEEISGKYVSFFIVCSILLFYLPDIVLKLYIKSRERKVMQELLLFSEVIFISLQAKLCLNDALLEASKTTKYLRPYLQICLNEWHNDKLRALNNLKKKVGVLGFGVVIDMLIQAANVGDEGVLQYIEENKKMEYEIRNIEISRMNKLRPLMLTIQMILPLLAILIILFYPLSIQVESLINSYFE